MIQTASHSQALAQIELLIVEQEKKLQALKEERNSHLGAIRLPVEVLTEIFLCVVQRLFKTFHSPKFQLSISHVCRYWRTIVLHSQQFWRYQPVNRDGMRWPTQMIERAAGHSLHLRIDDECYSKLWDPSVLESIKPTLAQASSVSVMLHGYVRRHRALLFSPPLSSLCPNLESAAVLTDDRYSECEFPYGLFGNDLSHLRQLSLHQVLWRWDAPYFTPSLTSLHLQGRVRFDKAAQAVLCQLSSLRYLEMHDTTSYGYGFGYDDLPDSNESINFPHLQELGLGEHPVSITYLLNHFDFPDSTKINLCCSYGRRGYHFSGSEDFDLLSSWILLQSKQLEKVNNPLCALQIRKPGKYTIHLSFWTRSQIIDSLKPLGITKPHIEFDLTNDRRFSQFFQGGLRRLATHIPLPTVEHLSLDTIPAIEHPNEVFGALSNVRILHVSGLQSSLDQLDVLTQPRSAKKEESSGDTDDEASSATGNMRGNYTDDGDAALQSPLLPMLHTVILQGAVLEGSDRLLMFASRRALAGCPIRTFRISECQKVSYVWLQELQKIVSVVEWDGNGEDELSPPVCLSFLAIILSQELSWTVHP